MIPAQFDYVAPTSVEEAQAPAGWVGQGAEGRLVVVDTASGGEQSIATYDDPAAEVDPRGFRSGSMNERLAP